MKYLKIDECDIANGRHVGLVLWVSGCNMNCPGCHNRVAWDYDAGLEFTPDVANAIVEKLNMPHIKRLTLSGGHPIDERNIDGALALLKFVRENAPNIEIWVYTGYTIQYKDGKFCVWMNQNKEFNDKINETLSLCDYVVDGEYVDSLRDITLAFRGSTNQDIIDIKATIKNGSAVMAQEKFD